MFPQRERYVPSGRVNLIRLAVWFLLTTPLTLLVGYLLCVAFRNDFYILFIAPLFAGLLVAGVTWMTVWGGACRNRWVGAATGVAGGLVALLGYYHFDRVHEDGLATIHRVDWLPAYIQFRVATDRVQEVGPRARQFGQQGQNAPGKVAPPEANGWGWAMLLLDLVCITAIPAGAGWTRASRPFAESAQRWLHEQIFFLEPDDAHDLAESLDEGDLEGVGEAADPIPAKQIGNQGELRLYYLPYDPDSPVYLTLWIVEGKLRSKKWPKKLATMIRLTPDEATVLGNRLQPVGGKFHEPPVVEEVRDRRGGGPAAAVVDLPEQDAGKVMNARVFTVLTVIALGPLALSLLLAVGLVVFLVVYWSVLALLVKVVVGVAAVGVVVVALVLTAMYGDYLPTQIQRRLCAAAIRQRGDAVVDPDEEGVWCVGVIPRKNWGKVMLDNADDLGFFKIDANRRLLLFEGDRQRWVIPAGQVEACELEEFCVGPPDPKEGNVFVVAVLKADVDGQRWEAPLSPIPVTARRPPAADRRKRCRVLRKAIRQLMAPAEA